MKRVGGVATVFPAEGGHVRPEENLLQVVYDHGPVQVPALAFNLWLSNSPQNG